MLSNPYENWAKSPYILKTNFHAHAGCIDKCSKRPLDQFFAAYAEAGYHAIALTNHNVYTDAKEIAAEYNVIGLDGYEYTSDPHICCIGTAKVMLEEQQKAIDNCVKEGGFAFLCHPHWKRYDYLPDSLTKEFNDYIGLEIYNGIVERMEGNGLSEDVWDKILSSGRLTWGFGNDDFHGWIDLGRAYNIVFSETYDAQGVIESIKKGRFYVSTGLSLKEFNFDGTRIEIAAYISEKTVCNHDYEYWFIGENGAVLSKTTGQRAEYKLIGNEKYIRIDVRSLSGFRLWTQPLYNV